jgi:hypothetical protein
MDEEEKQVMTYMAAMGIVVLFFLFVFFAIAALIVKLLFF